MPKNKLTDYSATNASNTDVGGINIDEGMQPSSVNDAIREVMTHLKDFSDGTSGVDVLNLQDDDASASIKIQAPATVTATTTFTLPDGDGSSGQVLQTNGTGTLSWTSNGLANVVEDTTPQLGGNLDLNSSDITGTGDINITGTVTADGLTVDGDVYIAGRGTSYKLVTPDFRIYNNASNALVVDNYANTNLTIASNGDISFYDSTGVSQGLFWQASTQRLGIGDTTPDDTLTVYGGTAKLRIGSTDSNHIRIGRNTTSGNFEMSRTTTGATDQVFFKAIEANNGNIILQEGGGNVGIGQSSPQSYLNASTKVLHLKQDTVNGSGVVMESDSCITELLAGSNASYLYNYTSDPMVFGTNNTERMRIDSSGNLLVGKTTTDFGVAGVNLESDGNLGVTRSGAAPINANRLSSDGDIARFYKDGSTVGSIGSRGAGTSYIILKSTGGAGAGLTGSDNRILPMDESALADANTDLGMSSYRFKDLYLSGRLTNDGTGGVSVDAGGDVEIIQEGTGRLKAVGGIFLGGTGAANHLDDYEEGTWNVTIVNGSLTPTVTTASYTKIGNRVFLSCHLVVPTNSESLYMALGGLPFATSGDSAGSLAYTTATTSDSIGLLVQGSVIYFYKDATPYATSEFSNKQLRLSAQYKTA